MVKNSLFTCLIILVVSGKIVFAQSESDTVSVPFKKFDNGFNLNFINGYALGYKWNNRSTWNSRLYLTLNIDADRDDSNQEQNNYSASDTSLMSSTGDDSDSRLSIGISYHLLNNFYSAGNFRSYAGGGVYTNYSLNKDFYTRTNLESNAKNEYSSTRTTYSLGLSGILGIEVEITPNITIYTESSLSAGKYWTSYDYTNESVYNDENDTWNKYIGKESSDGWRLSFTLIKVGIGIYF